MNTRKEIFENPLYKELKQLQVEKEKPYTTDFRKVWIINRTTDLRYWLRQRVWLLLQEENRIA